MTCFLFPKKLRGILKTLITCCHSSQRKEGTMKTFNMPGSPETRTVFLPDVARS
jgi:hypothetical protein